MSADWSADVPRRRGWDDRNKKVHQAYWNGWQDRADEEARIHQPAADRLHGLANQPPADELAERRGEHERAQRIREFWHLTGLRTPQDVHPDPTARAALVTRARGSWGLPPERRTSA